MPLSHRRKLSRHRMIKFLEALSHTIGKATSLYVPPGMSRAEIQELLQDILNGGDVQSDIAGAMADSQTGAVFLGSEAYKYLVLPPFPLTEKQVFPIYDVDPLYALLKSDLTIALILLRLGDYAIGVFRGEERLSGKVGTGLVHSRHKKGGSSQRRFERHREKQMEQFFDRVCSHAREHLEPHSRQVDHVIYGGERHTLLAFRRQCRFMQCFDNRTLRPLLNVRKPRAATLEAAIEEVWSSMLIQWIED